MGVRETERRTIEREEGREEAPAACGSEGLAPFWSSLQKDGGHMGGEGISKRGEVVIYSDLGGGHLCKSVDGKHCSLNPGWRAGK